MTPMDSDSESQDSDEGRRFRFEATRKDPVAPVDTTSRTTKSPKKKSKHKSSQRDDSSSRHYRERKERSKYESTRKTDDKDLRHLIKHTKSQHESRSGSRQEDSGGKNLHRDASTGNDRGPRHCCGGGGGDTRERSRDSKRQSDRDRSVHRVQRSREHSYEKNQDELLRGSSSSGDKHRARDRHKHRSRDRSRERSHQSSKLKSSSGERSREDHGKTTDSARKLSVKENKSQNSKDYSSKSVERACSRSSESRSTLIRLDASEDMKKESPSDVQDCRELDLSQFDVLSETDENTSDAPDSRCRALPLRHRESKPMREHDSAGDRSESREPPKKRARAEERQERHQVKMRNHDEDGDDDDKDCGDPASGPSNNNHSAVSDSSLVPFETIAEKSGDTRADYSARERLERRSRQERTTLADNNSDAERSSSRERRSRHPAAVSDETRSLERGAKRSSSIYGPLPIPEITLDDEQLETSSSRRVDSNHHRKSRRNTTSIVDDNHDGVVDNGERRVLVGPCLPPSDKTKSAVESRADDPKEAAEDVVDMAFGPALPPHLLQRTCDKSPEKIIGPVLPDSLKKTSRETFHAESDDDCAIGPLPEDHPALRNSRVHEQLDLRARRIRHEGYSEEVDVGNKREEWMTELPPAQAANLGLGPRKFRIRDGPDMSDRSCWTDTPAQKVQKQRDSERRRFSSSTEESDKRRAKECHKRDSDKSTKREKSLLEMHQSKMARRKRNEEKEAKLSGGSTRRPFDRDIDLQVNRLDQAQKKTILMKARMLDDRFSRGQI
ncbi:histone-lysine N-methyltransferase, H3 lysine-4 specific [Harpegnathos saltator]|uniref:histone-lysine N-methyltransferase, H3 lysine-4 specific n=1 Tax=Harpegnathos saltator TaxID=610380 RepID=UPI00058EF500|nr:histone-lysine N-methyltransferase, H3 lysine-4 specific [Harpegnathos saltator]XP_011138260.1 histone-lysine N-methyltransferase, H3 lysine-4 specific [Harpegnathos saltator]XP_019696619.1 histone-lysine N-methyltransferase, H3 lysine-4 specific [Harpegnathos saltator]XP_025152878.1 histone-lysine N-methyltransferase, H3 lysine-4 specific [Harpegnathos saltator]